MTYVILSIPYCAYAIRDAKHATVCVPYAIRDAKHVGHELEPPTMHPPPHISPTPTFF